MAPTELARLWAANTFTRARGSYQSDRSGRWVGVTTARPMPAPMRATSSTAIDQARPVSTEKQPHAAAPTVAIRTRLARSHQNDRGTSTAMTAMVVTATSVSAPESLSPKASRMFGRRTAKAVRSSSSTALSPKRTASGKTGWPIVIADGRHSSRSRASALRMTGL